MMNQKSVILLIGFLALISDAWILDLERAQRTLEEIDREETTAKGKGKIKEVFTKPSERILETIPETILETIPKTIPETIPKTIPETNPETIPETVQKTLLETKIPLSTSVPAEPKWPWSKTSGIIFLHGLGVWAADGRSIMCNAVSEGALGLSFLRNRISCPLAPIRDAEIIRNLPLIGDMVEDPEITNLLGVRSWFDFKKMPKLLVRESDSRSESKPDLEEALGWVEEEIEKMIEEGIPSENIVLSGMSQGGALTLYTALHTRYKLGGFLPMVTWLPLLGSEPPVSLPTPINKDTPIFHMNGNIDEIVPEECGRATAKAMEPVFTNYEQKNEFGTHLTTLGNPMNFPIIYCWLRNNVPNMAFSYTHAFNLLPC